MDKGLYGIIIGLFLVIFFLVVMANFKDDRLQVNMQIGIGIFLIILGLFTFTIGILNKIETPIRGYCFLNIRKGSIIEAISINGAEEKILVYRAP